MHPEFTNHLIHETSPYLLQHAHNPVDWHPWNEAVLSKAKQEDKPILISIGYSACHWCHVMERESFEDVATASLMNEYFINIKVDREERPDLDHIYMDAVQAISGGGGWPLNVFLTPEGKPFYGGTYFPPVRAYNRMSWKELLKAIYKMFKEKRSEIEMQAENLVQHLITSNTFINTADSSDKAISRGILKEINENILKTADKDWGGFGNAPKFPQSFTIRYLLKYHYFTGNKESLDQALLSLNKMIAGGIYDQAGGGFARYSTDAQWLAPHFEKMLYDNALLLSVISEAYQLTKISLYATTIEQTLQFITREMLSPEGAFYSALDADSEGVEGKFYTWSKKEIDEIIGADSEIFCQLYDVSEKGNWEHTNILWLPETLERFAEKRGLDMERLTQKIAQWHQKLLVVRENRIRPGLDDKILLGWNALMITACCQAYAALGTVDYLQLAENNITFLEKNLRSDSGTWFHTWKSGQATVPAFLDDLSYLIQAYIQLQEVTGNNDYLLKAKRLTELVIRDYSDEEELFFYFTPKEQQDVIVRKKEVYDGATPSGNGLMASNLFYLSIVFDRVSWRQRSEKMILSLEKAIRNYPGSFGVWACAHQNLANGMKEIVIAADNQFLKDVNTRYIPDKVLQFASGDEDSFPLLKGKTGINKPEIFLCQNYVCLKPVQSVDALLELLKL